MQTPAVAGRPISAAPACAGARPDAPPAHLLAGAPAPDSGNPAAPGRAIVWSDEHASGAWLVSDYAQVSMALKDPRFSVQRAARWINGSTTQAACRRSEQQKLQQFKRILARSMLFLDGPSHARLRRSVQAGFSQLSLQSQAPKIAALVQQLLGRIRAAAVPDGSGRRVAEFDFIRDFARPLPALVIASLMGIAPDRQDGFIDAAAAIAAFIGTPSASMEQALAAQQALCEMRGYFSAIVSERRLAAQAISGSMRGAEDATALAADGAKSGLKGSVEDDARDSAAAAAASEACAAAAGDDLVGHLIRAENAGQISAAEMLAQCCTLLFAGYETTRHLLGNGLLRLLQHPAQWRAQKDSVAGRQNALRELLRFDSPVQYTGRRLTADVCLGGRHMQKGQLVILRIAAANRDAARFTDPDQLQLGRDQGNHLSFGHGVHVCIGARLTYLEAEIAFQALSPLMAAMQVDHQGLSWQPFPAYRGLETLPLRWVVGTTDDCPDE